MSTDDNGTVFRNADAWSRVLEVDGQRRHLTDREVDTLKSALENFRDSMPRCGRSHTASALLYFLATGRVPREDDRELRAWRDRMLDEEKRP